MVVNGNHPLVSKILSEDNTEAKEGMIKQATDLALLAQNMLDGEELTNFIQRNYAELA